MTPLQFMREELRALDRLNPRLLSSGGYLNEEPGVGVTVCATGAWRLAAALGKKGRATSLDRHTTFLDSLPWDDGLGPGSLDIEIDKLISKSDGFRRNENSRKDQQARWASVRRYVEKRIAKLEAQAS